MTHYKFLRIIRIVFRTTVIYQLVQLLLTVVPDNKLMVPDN